ncbi:MAG: hypothetical protein J7623_11460 [Chitinophaga sp.]|uniref:hypothetical protein n=1 Tax=Chitinophaga sp. TaxID=1869181 RepID=UPI001B15B7DF|nr:hypothetical protein [Chitinophaga sp.]MBO9729244.1 hypothetical protein [Chitinophaga sp.]
MKKIFGFLMLITTCSACMKEDQQISSNKIIIIYEVESNTDIPFTEIKYGSGTAGANQSWSVSGIGTFQKTDTLKKGIGVFMEARHPSSNKWKIRIKTTDESLLIEGPVKFSGGTPGYYYSTIGATVN